MHAQRQLVHTHYYLQAIWRTVRIRYALTMNTTWINENVTFWLALTWALLLTALSLACSVHILLNKHEPRATIGWIALCLGLPLFGPLLYFLLGINRVSRRAKKLRADGSNPSRLEVTRNLHIKALPPPSDGSRIEAFTSGHTALDAMLVAIKQAKSRVWLSMYIFERKGIGNDFIGAIADAVSRGVTVNVLLDGVGALYGFGNTAKKLRQAGAAVAMFIPPKLFPPSWRLNLRNHRKILVVDNDIAFVGGMNIRNGYIGRIPDEKPTISDLHFRLTGAIVTELTDIFADDWAFATGAELTLPTSAQHLTSETRLRVVVDGPDNDTDLLTLAIQSAFASAQSSIRLMTPYFLPPQELISGLQAAALRGVNVSIVLPAKNNLPYIHWATRHMLEQLLRFDVNVSYQNGCFDHSKLLLVDDNYSLVGSPNIDPRSLRLNFEIALEVWDVELAAQLDAHFEQRLSDAQPITLEDIRSRSILAKLRDAIAWLFSPYW